MIIIPSTFQHKVWNIKIWQILSHHRFDISILSLFNPVSFAFKPLTVLLTLGLSQYTWNLHHHSAPRTDIANGSQLLLKSPDTALESLFQATAPCWAKLACNTKSFTSSYSEHNQCLQSASTFSSFPALSVLQPEWSIPYSFSKFIMFCSSLSYLGGNPHSSSKASPTSNKRDFSLTLTHIIISFYATK